MTSKATSSCGAGGAAWASARGAGSNRTSAISRRAAPLLPGRRRPPAVTRASASRGTGVVRGHATESQTNRRRIAPRYGSVGPRGSAAMSLAKKLNLKAGTKLRVLGKPKEVDLDDVDVTSLANVKD